MATDKKGDRTVVTASPERKERKVVTTKDGNKGDNMDELSALLSLQSSKEREERSQQEEILSLLSKPTTRHGPICLHIIAHLLFRICDYCRS